MDEPAAVPIIVLSSTRDPVETINSILRRAGQPAHCTWLPGLPDLPDALPQINPELLIAIGNDPQLAIEAAKIREQIAPAVPLLAVADEFDENRAAQLMRAGVRDLVSIGHIGRLEAVMLRELRAFRLERALNATLQTARDYRKQLETVLASSNDAIAQAQEGILVEANDAWLELFGYADGAVLIGQPIMDFFDASSQPALKGALGAALQGRWDDRSLNLIATLADGSHVAIDVMLSPSQYDDAPAVRLMVPGRKRGNDGRDLAAELADAVRRDSATGLLQRLPLIDAIRERLTVPAPGGLRAIACVRLDKFAALEKEIGLDGSESVLTGFVKIFQAQLSAHDIAGRFSGATFLALLERGNENDLEAWARQLIEQTGRALFDAGRRKVKCSCSVAVRVIAHSRPDVDAAVLEALEAVRRSRKRGTALYTQIDQHDADTRVLAYDQIWVKHIKAALLENRFKLVQQPIANLQGDEPRMFDVAVRMLDPQGKEVLPSDFMPAAERNDLLKNIDRWVIGAALAFAAQKRPECLFVRLSKDSLIDPSLPDWLDLQLRSSRVQPSRVCFQVPEKIVIDYEPEALTLTRALKQRGLRFALERYGQSGDPAAVIGKLPLDFVKIDGALVQSLATNFETQEKVRALVAVASAAKIQTIAERVEDANTMAVLWQLGVQYIQGYFINQPEAVVLADRPDRASL